MTTYTRGDDEWADILRSALEAVREADAQVAAICRERGIPEEFRPSLGYPTWYQRGENAMASRRAELRTAAKANLDAGAKKTKLAIQRATLDQVEAPLVSGLNSQEAHDRLAQIPTVEALLPPLDVQAIEAATPRRDRHRQLISVGGGEAS